MKVKYYVILLNYISIIKNKMFTNGYENEH